MNLLCVGINHRTAPLAARESVWYSKEEVLEILPRLKEKFFRECVLISTCNRTELYGILRDASTDADRIITQLISAKAADQKVHLQQFYTLSSLTAVRHVLNLASGIDSMMVGDIQILNQMKEAYSLAQRAHTTGVILTRLFQAAFHTGKRARSETEISDGAVSISYAAVELASKIFADLSVRKALLLGAGNTGKLTAKHLLAKRIGKLIIANRTREHADDVARILGGTVVDYERMRATLPEIDILITSVTAPHHVLTADEIHSVMKERGNNPLVIIDIGVPRNVDPAANKMDNVFLHDIDSLKLIVDRNLEKRKSEFPKIQQIVHDELLNFFHWYKSLDVAPTIEQLREQFEIIRKNEVEKHINRFSPENRELVEMLTKRIVNKILHTPTINLKNGDSTETSDETLHKVSIVRSLFGLRPKVEGSLRKPSDE